MSARSFKRQAREVEVAALREGRRCRSQVFADRRRKLEDEAFTADVEQEMSHRDETEP